VAVPARRVAGLVLIVALSLTACTRASPPNPVGPATVDCDWHITLQSFPGMDAAITPPVTVPARGHQTMTLATNLGVITVEIDLAKAPCTAASLDFLVGKHLYDGAACPVRDPTNHTVLCGPSRQVGYEFSDENLPGVNPAYQPGDVAIFEEESDTNGGQILFVYGPSRLSDRYTRWGRVLTGLDVLAPAGVGHPKIDLTLQSVTVGPVH
jgi:peptidyl-prolyl cis-trans isomerase B (cyclophilin B)